MLGNEVARTRVQRASQEGTNDQIGKRAEACVSHKEEVKNDLSNDIQEVNLGQGQLVHHHRTNGVEKDLEGAEEGLAKDRIQEESLKRGGQVGV